MKRISSFIILAFLVLGLAPGIAGAAFWDPDPTPTSVPVPTPVPQVTPANPKPRPAKRPKPSPTPESKTPDTKEKTVTLSVEDPTPKPTKTNVPIKPDVFSTDHMKGRWGIGKGSIYQVGTGLGLRYWGQDNEAYDLVVAMYDRPNPGSSFDSTYTGSDNWAAGLSLGLRRDLSRPVEDVRVQAILNFQFSMSIQENNTVTVSDKNDTYNFSLGVGTGFEAYLPFWKNISLEGQILFRLQDTISSSRRTRNPAYYSGPLVSGQDSNQLGVFWDTDPLTLLNLSVHFYF